MVGKIVPARLCRMNGIRDPIASVVLFELVPDKNGLLGLPGSIPRSEDAPTLWQRIREAG